MKDAQDNKLLKPGVANALPKRSRGSFSSSRSARTTHSSKSVESQRAGKLDPRRSLRLSAGKPRPRGFSLSSVASQAVSTSSGVSGTLSKKTSHADDSDATGSNESLGETEEDVWFPTRAREPAGSDDIKMSELDQLLNLSDSEDNNASGRNHAEPLEAGPAENANDDALADADDEGAGLPHIIHPENEGFQQGSRFFAIRKDSSEAPGPRTESPGHKDAEADVATTKVSPDGDNNNAESAPPSPKSFPFTYNDKFDSFASGSGSGSGSRSGSRPGSQSGSGSGSTGSVPNEAEKLTGLYDPPIVSSSRTEQPPRTDQSSVAVNETVAGGDEPSQRFSFFASNMESTIHAPDLASLVGQSDSFSSLFNPQNGVWFLDCFRPTEVEMKALSRAFGIHPLTSEDIQTEDAREKFEMFRRYYLVVYHTFENDEEDENYLQPINFYMLVFSEGVISFHFEPVSHCRNVRRRMRHLRDYLTFSSDWIAYALIDDITDSFAPAIQTIEGEADYVEAAIYRNQASVEISTLLSRLGDARKRTMQLLRMLTGKADVVRGFAKRCTESHNMPGHEMALYLGDIQDHIVTMSQNLSAYEKIFSRAHFNYMGLLQMEFVDSSNRMTSVLGKVTVLGTVLVPMNLITGLFGMNVKVPGQDGSNLGWFFGILGLILVLILVLMVGGHYYIKTIERNHIIGVS